MKHFQTALILFAIILFTTSLRAEIPFKVVRGGQDTVYNNKHTLICMTEPGNLAIVNDTQVKVLPTGAFGIELLLKEGDNTIEVTLFKNKMREIRELYIYYSPQKPIVPERTMTLSQARTIIDRSTLHETLKFVTSTMGAYLQYGDGDDRLGGSKMSYVDTGIVFKVIGTIGDLYKVQLSNNRYAYLPIEYTSECDKKNNTVNTGSWYVSNIGKYDRVRISLPEKLPYCSWSELDPTSICLDIFGAMNNSNWITQMANLQEIGYVDFRQVDSDVMRVIIKLKNKYQWGYSVKYEGTNLIVDVKHAPELTLRGMRIGLDAGHGGTASGAVGITGVNEKDVNLMLVKQVQKLLEEKGAIVVLSRQDDRDMTMTERKKIFKENEIDLLLSIHNNAGGSALVSPGSSTYYKHISNRELASTMLNRLLEMGFNNYGLVGNFNFSLAAPTEYPAVLLEVLFMSCIYDEAMLSDVENQKVIAKQILLGLEDYLIKVDESLISDNPKAKSKKRRR